MRVERFVCGRSRSNAYVVAPANDRCLIVDAGVGAAPRVIDLVGADGLLPQAVLLTHGHPDHIWTARQLSDRFEVPVYIHRDDVGWFSDPATGRHLPVVRYAGAALGYARRIRPRRLNLVDEGSFDAGPFNVAFVHTPGHSRGSACIRVEETWFVGDTVFRGAVGNSGFPGGSATALRESLRTKLLPLPDDARLLPGHGEETIAGAERNAWKSYIGR